MADMGHKAGGRNHRSGGATGVSKRVEDLLVSSCTVAPSAEQKKKAPDVQVVALCAALECIQLHLHPLNFVL